VAVERQSFLTLPLNGDWWLASRHVHVVGKSTRIPRMGWVNPQSGAGGIQGEKSLVPAGNRASNSSVVQTAALLVYRHRCPGAIVLRSKKAMTNSNLFTQNMNTVIHLTLRQCDQASLNNPRTPWKLTFLCACLYQDTCMDYFTAVSVA